MSIGKLVAGQEGYYLSAVAHGAEDYYLAGGEVPGYWTGSGAAQLGLDGVVEDDAFVGLLRGVHPVDGSPLGRANRRVPTLDLTFSAPKSVSVAWGLGGPEIAGEIVAAHEDAIAAALAYLEREAVFVRRGHNGTERLLGGGLVGAAFRHRTSRAGDPQLHTHVVVANAAQGPDGRWSALDARHLYGQARTAGFLYQAELRAGLTARLDPAWDPVVKGTGDLTAVPVGVRREFSRRRAQIEAELTADASPREARLVTLRTRPSKAGTADGAALRADWTERAAALDFTANELADALRRVVQTGVEGDDPSRVSAPHLCTALTEHMSSFDRRHVLQAVAENARTGTTVGEIEAAADTLLGSESVVALGVGRFGIVYSTPELLALEGRTLDQAEDRQGESCGVVEDLGPLMSAARGLSGEQTRMIRTVTADGAGVAVVVGAAGSGKTHALSVTRDMWVGDGYTVIGCALAARAARQLQDDARIPSVTLDRLLIDLDRSDTPGLTARTVIVADEAAMIGTRKLARLLDHAHHAHAKVVLVGDPRQLPEIEAGGMFVALTERLGATELVGNRRQQDPVERQALAELRAGQVEEAIERLAEHGNITELPDRDTAIDRIVADWRYATIRGDDAIMLALHRSDVTALNHAARQARMADAIVDREPVIINGRPFARGDRVMTLRNDPKRGLINGERGMISSVFPRDGFYVRFNSDQSERLIPHAYINAGHLDHAYAMTVHKAQGLTCDRAYVLGSADLYAEAGYTALSRGRLENHLYTTIDEPDVDHHGATTDDPLHQIHAALAHSQREHLATRHAHVLPAAEHARDTGHDHGIEISR